MRRVWRSVTAFAIAACLTAPSALAPEHVHEADATHPQALVHRHLAAHDHHDDSEISHDDDHVVWLEDVSLRPATYTVAPDLATVSVYATAFRDLTSWIATASYDTAPPHGPPRAALALRGPPSFSA